MPTDPTILLDTNIVAGAFAVSKKGDHVDAQTKLWRSTVAKLGENIVKAKILVPTPVCFELMCMNKDWHDFIANSNRAIFRYAKSDIPSSIVLKASEYFPAMFKADNEGNSQKKNIMDVLIATYSLVENCYLMTTNENHFPPSHFEVAGTESLTLSGKDGKKHRKTIYLLKPIQE